MAKIETNWNKAKLEDRGFKQILGPKQKSHAPQEIEMTDFSKTSIKSHQKSREFEDLDLRRKGSDNNGGDDNATQQIKKRQRSQSF
jgi:hypothetical protein